MSDHDTNNALAHVATTAGGGGLVASIIEFFRGREQRKLAERVAVLEQRLDDLEDDMKSAKCPVKLTRKKRTKRA